MDVMMIFDILILGLGLYLIIYGMKHYKDGTVGNVVIAKEDLQRCADEKALSKYLMPKTALFGVLCIVCGAQGVLNDTKILEAPRVINALFLLLFMAAWGMFSVFINKAKKQYLH